MPSLRILYDVDGWAYHHNARGLERYAPADFTVSLSRLRGGADVDQALGDTPPDVLLLLPTSRVLAVRAAFRQRRWPTKLVTATSSGWPSQLGRFFLAYQASDALLVSNREYQERTGLLPGTYLAPYGVDPAVFRITTPIEERRPRVLWTGSILQRATKGYDDYLRPLQTALHARGIEADFCAVASKGDRGRRTAAEMSAWYNTGTVYVCASRAEGTPNPALEAAACGCTVVSTRVGNMPELIRNGDNGHLVEREIGALLAGVEAAITGYPRLARQMQADIQAWLWPRRAPVFYEVCRKVLSADPISVTRATPRPRASSPVGVVTPPAKDRLGEARLALLDRQDHPFVSVNAGRSDPGGRIEVPSCGVGVDEDVLPYPWALRRLVEGLAAAPPEVAAVTGTLFDVQLRRPVARGLAVFRGVKGADLLREAGSTAAAIARLQAAGQPVVGLAGDAEPLGLCGTRWTHRAIYEQAAEVQRRRMTEAAADGSEPPEELVRRVLEERSELDFFALMGVITGAMEQRHDRDATPGFSDLARYLQALGRWWTAEP